MFNHACMHACICEIKTWSMKQGGGAWTVLDTYISPEMIHSFRGVRVVLVSLRPKGKFIHGHVTSRARPLLLFFHPYSPHPHPHPQHLLQVLYSYLPEWIIGRSFIIYMLHDDDTCILLADEPKRKTKRSFFHPSIVIHIRASPLPLLYKDEYIQQVQYSYTTFRENASIEIWIWISNSNWYIITKGGNVIYKMCNV